MAAKIRVKDFAIPMDEFHPSPSIAAAFADRKANDATVTHLTLELKRLDAQIQAAPRDRAARLTTERGFVAAFLRQANEDRKEIDRLIQEAKVK